MDSTLEVALRMMPTDMIWGSGLRIPTPGSSANDGTIASGRSAKSERIPASFDAKGQGDCPQPRIEGTGLMGDYQVTCIIPDGGDTDRRIDRLGGTFHAESQPIDTVIRWIDEGHTFWTMVSGRRVRVIDKRHPQTNRRYLTTEGDGFPPNNLLKLPRCP